MDLLEETANELGGVFADTLLNLDWESVGYSIGKAIYSGVGLMDDLLMPNIYDSNGQKVEAKSFEEVFGPRPNGSHADGLDYVPYDGYVAELHKGEMVVPAMESRYLRSGGLGSSNAEVLMMLERILYAVQDQDNKNISLSVNNREFARLVKAVN